ncbi:LPS O-antigen length regulator [Shewanella sp. OPT22]|nr:LPS O-antigen length regulator [Shewanella sp. OPT22]
MENKTNTQLPQNFVADDEIDLKELFSAIWQGKWLITAITTVFAIGSVIFALMQPNIYKSEALLSPVTEKQGGGLSALAGQFGGLASLAGINLGGGASGDKSQLAIQILKSREFTSSFIQKHNILPDLMAVEEWNRNDNSISYDPKLYNSTSQKWVREVNLPKHPKPSMQEAYKEFAKILNIGTDKETGMVTISIEHQSPYIAQNWVKWLVADINTEMKIRDVSEAHKSIQFLENELKQTRVSDIRTMLFSLVEEQTKTIMFSKVRDEYVFKTIDPALVPEEKAKPKRALICVLGTMLGGMLGVMLVLIRHFVRKES